MERGFTLVIPLYNKVKAVKATLDSVLINHGEYPFKCIIVDDDSTDGSSEIAEEYDINYPDIFQYVKIKHHGDKNPINARNFGIKLAETEYIGFLDADDELCAGFIDRGCNFLDEHPEYSLYGNGFISRISEDGNILEIWHKYSSDDITNFIEYVTCGGVDMPFCTNIYKTELVKLTPFDIDYPGAEDTKFKLRYIYYNPKIYIDNNQYESIVYNTHYSDSFDWDMNKTSGLGYIFEYLKNTIPNFGYDIIMDDDNYNFAIYKTQLK